jgi:hypothetical protein
MTAPSRRVFLEKSLQATGTALAASQVALERAAAAPLPAPRFYWGVGIENCWIAQTDPARDGNRRLLDVFLQMQHYERWKEDLDLLPEVGCNAIRYSVPWYRAEPRPGVYDWSWIDKPVTYLVDTLKVVPIMDLIHYGTPAWMPDGVLDDRFPDAIAAYAGAMAAHFNGLVNHYSPHNEPGLTCLFCGLVGRWPPYRKSIEDWAKIGVRVARGMVLEAEAIRQALPDAVIVSVDPFFYGTVEPHLPPAPPGDPLRRELLRSAAAYPASLAYGKITADHPLAHFLRAHGVPAADLEWFHNRARKPDILGTNRYPSIRRPAPAAGSPPPSVEETARRGAAIVKEAILDAQTYFDLPVYLTETSDGTTDESKVAFIHALYDMVQELRQARVPIVGVNWWPLFETIQWDYREHPERPLADFIYPGGWNNGLYTIRPQADGTLRRVRTRAVDAYRAVLARDRA